MSYSSVAGHLPGGGSLAWLGISTAAGSGGRAPDGGRCPYRGAQGPFICDFDRGWQGEIKFGLRCILGLSTG